MQGFEYAEAHDGQMGVELFESTPANYWEWVLSVELLTVGADWRTS